MIRCDMMVLERTEEFSAIAARMTVSPCEWEFLLALDGWTSVGAIAHRLHIGPAALADLVDEVVGRGLARSRVVSMEEYLAESSRRALHESPTLRAMPSVAQFPARDAAPAAAKIQFKIGSSNGAAAASRETE
jgi:hypothetical protein